MAASPTIGDVKAFNKLATQCKSQPLNLQFWPLTGPLRIIWFPDVSHRNNEDGSSQRGMTVFLAESRERSSKDGMSYGSLIDYESQKIKKTVLSSTVAELYDFMKCFVSCRFLRGLWMDLSGEVADIHMRTDAKNVVTTASLNKRRQFTWSPCWERKPVQGVCRIFFTFQCRIVQQISWRTHQQRQIIWLQRWKPGIVGCWHPSHSWNTHGTQHLLVYMVQDIYANKGEGCSLPKWFEGISRTNSTKNHSMWCLWRQTIVKNQKKQKVCDWNHLLLSVTVPAKPTSRRGRELNLTQSHFAAQTKTCEHEGQHATKITSALTDTCIQFAGPMTSTSVKTLSLSLVLMTIFLTVLPSFFSQLCDHVVIKTDWCS